MLFGCVAYAAHSGKQQTSQQKTIVQRVVRALGEMLASEQTLMNKMYTAASEHNAQEFDRNLRSARQVNDLIFQAIDEQNKDVLRFFALDKSKRLCRAFNTYSIQQYVHYAQKHGKLQFVTNVFNECHTQRKAENKHKNESAFVYIYVQALTELVGSVVGVYSFSYADFICLENFLNKRPSGDCACSKLPSGACSGYNYINQMLPFIDKVVTGDQKVADFGIVPNEEIIHHMLNNSPHLLEHILNRFSYVAKGDNISDNSDPATRCHTAISVLAKYHYPFARYVLPVGLLASYGVDEPSVTRRLINLGVRDNRALPSAPKPDDKCVQDVVTALPVDRDTSTLVYLPEQTAAAGPGDGCDPEVPPVSSVDEVIFVYPDGTLNPEDVE